MSDTPLGRFCWYDLMTPDPDKTPAFYGPITGWGTAPFEGGAEPYTMWMNGDAPIGGTMALPQEAVDHGAPPHWLAYISTPDLDATATKAKELGATVLNQMDIPTVGSIAIIRDPQGVVFAAYQPADFTPGHDGPANVGEFSWHELMTEDWQAAWSFYSELFGWRETEQMDMGEMGVYHMFGRGEASLGGMMNRPAEVPASYWIYYVRVSDIDEAVEKIREGGGQILNGPMDVPGGDKVAQCVDDQGAAFAIHSTAQG